MAYLNAKPTMYRDIPFRSTLEARWAATFDQLGIKWEYEAKYYELTSGVYIPDFWWPRIKWLVEIKPDLENAEIARYKELVDLTRRPFLLLAGKPEAGIYRMRYMRGGRNKDLIDGQFAQFPNSKLLWITSKDDAVTLGYEGLMRKTPPSVLPNGKHIIESMSRANKNFD